MQRTTVLRVLVVVALVGGVVTGADALVVTDAERLDRFAEALTTGSPATRLDRALTWMNTDREPVTLRVNGETSLYSDGHDADLADAARAALGPFATEGKVLQRSVEVHGREGRVALRYRANATTVDATLDLRRHDDRWLVSRIQTRSP